ncbi:MAG: NAD(P)-binding protein [Deltaproteobacteria bacterium]|nr:NAD(P)-binding protein [Deltaproteobacteria bacterium]
MIWYERLLVNEADTTEQKPVRVAVIGGGCAAMTAAFELTQPHLKGRYQITVYQPGWRLGGKGASGRGPSARIEEHGLHLWMGFYENAFRLMRECYGELARDPRTCPIADWRDAFQAAPLIGVTDQLPSGEWQIWKGMMPPSDGLPGDKLPAGHSWTIADYMLRTVGLVRNLLETIRQSEPAAAQASPSESNPSSLTEQVQRVLEMGELATLAGLTQGLALLEMVIGSLAQYPDNFVLRFLDALTRNARAVLESRLAQNVPLRRVWQVIDLTLATLRGMVRFGIAADPRGFDAIDDYDCREWLLLCGASPSAVDSGWVRALYDLGFSYENGDLRRPRIAAGQALRSMLRAFFTYRGSFFWRMQAGMGDIVFAPLYEVLKRRGVRFEFFHRLRNVTLGTTTAGANGRYVAGLELEVQARVRGGGEYQPLVDINGVPCWPSLPLYEQLEDSDIMRQRHFESHWDSGGAQRLLAVGTDFDAVVLGIGLGAVPHVCRELVARDARWRAMVDHVQTVATQAFQIWMTEDMAALGWRDLPINVSGFVEPFDTWADMQHLIGAEAWSQAPRALAYFCSVLPDLAGFDNADYPQRQRQQVRQNAVRFLNRDIGQLWPAATDGAGRFRWNILADAAQGNDLADGEDRFATQYWTANVNPSDRYILSLPGSTKYRISPLDTGYDNLTVAGDWTACSFNAGCVEAAVMSGRLAAHAIAESPPLNEIVGYDHP